jgi:hypothetical protein
MTFATVGCRWISKISNGIREPVMIAVNHSAQVAGSRVEAEFSSESSDCVSSVIRVNQA